MQQKFNKHHTISSTLQRLQSHLHWNHAIPSRQETNSCWSYSHTQINITIATSIIIGKIGWIAHKGISEGQFSKKEIEIIQWGGKIGFSGLLNHL